MNDEDKKVSSDGYYGEDDDLGEDALDLSFLDEDEKEDEEKDEGEGE